MCKAVWGEGTSVDIAPDDSYFDVMATSSLSALQRGARKLTAAPLEVLPTVAPRFSRRSFLTQTAVVSVLVPHILARSGAAVQSRTWRAAIIGATGQGNYGHGLDQAFQGFSAVKVGAVADPDAAGRARAAERSGAQRQYADYREMLAKEKPELVVIAPRWTEQRREMALEALAGGAHLLTEKPFTVTLADADEILALAGRASRKVSVAHQMRLAPSVVHLREAIKGGLIGQLLQIRSWGKQDQRAGGEDMLVLGTHVFDMMRLFAGDPLSCHAYVYAQGRAITREDGRPATERIGPVAGDEIEAEFEFAGGVVGHFTSRAGLRETLGHWSVELVGSQGVVRILMDIDPTVLQRRHPPASAAGRLEEWQPVRNDPTLHWTAEQRGFGPANHRVVEDWLAAIEEGREPACSGHNAMKTIEMVMAVYGSALGRRRVAFPLATRSHPLAV